MGVTRQILESGHGGRPQRGQTVTVHCIGKLAAGNKKFWSTYESQPFTFQVGIGQVIRGWDEGILQMQLGEKANLMISSDYGYGASGFPAWGIPANADLIFECKILEIKDLKDRFSGC